MEQRKKRATRASRLILVSCKPEDLEKFTQAVEALTWAITDLRMLIAAMPVPRHKKHGASISQALPVPAEPALF